MLPMPEKANASGAESSAKGPISALALAALAGSVVSYLLWDDALELTSSQSGATGIILGAWGLLVSLFGFAVTFWQLARTRKAAVAVNAAVGKLKRDFGQFDVVLELRTARGAAEETQLHLTGARWDVAVGSFNKLRASLSKMVAVRGGLTETQCEGAKDHIAFVLGICRSIEQSPGRVRVDTVNSRLREIDDFLIGIEFGVKDSLSGS